MNIGNVYHSLGNNAQAIEYYERGLTIQAEEKDKRPTAGIFLSVAAVHYSKSDYLQALVNYQKSLDISTEVGDKKGIADALSGLGNVYFEQRNYPHALKQYSASLKISQEMHNKDGIRANLNNIAGALSAQGDYVEALDHYKKGLAVADETGNKGAVAEMLFNMGHVHFVQKDYTRAREFYERSLETAQETGSKMVTANALAAIGAIYLYDRNYEKAAEFAERADSLAKSAELPDVRVAALTTKGQVSLALNQYEPARQAFQNAITAIEELRGGVVGDERQHQQFFENKLAPFHYMVRLMVDQHKPVEALEYAERAKGRALLDALQRQDLNVSKAMSPAEQQEERKLNGRIVSLNSQITLESRRDKPNNEVLADLYSKRAGARVDYETFQLNLYAAHPELKGRRAQMLPITLEQAGKLIPNAGSAILEYVVTADDVYLFVLTREHRAAAPAGEPAPAVVVKVYRLNVKNQDLEKNIARFEGRLSARDSGIAQPARELFDVLFGPARADLKTKKHLIIVPDGALWRVPFQALQRAAGRFLVEDYAISYATSITALHQMADLKARRAKDSSGTPSLMLVAFGDPDLGHAGPARRQAAMMNEKLTPLPEAERQVKTLQQIYGPAQSRIYIGVEATEERVRKESGASRILHLATHGVVDDTSPMYSYVVLSQSRVNENEDGLLEAREIMDLDLNCDLVVLAACNTAGGRVSKGEGVIGLAWSFFIGGSPAIVVSQWAVESSSTAALMIEFHKTLKASIDGQRPGVGKAEALRIAALKLLRTPRYRHPFYWAPFVVIGDDHRPSPAVRSF
jgi:CHAT domain-containing protein/uncharacterized protein HemY